MWNELCKVNFNPLKGLFKRSLCFGFLTSPVRSMSDLSFRKNPIYVKFCFLPCVPLVVCTNVYCIISTVDYL